VHRAVIACRRGPNPPVGNPRGHRRAGRLATGRTDQAVHLILGHDGMYGRDLGHLMPLGLGIFPPQQVLTAVTALRLDGDDDVHLLHRHQDPGLPFMARLPAWATPRGPALRPFAQGVGRIARGRPRRGARGLLQALRQLLDRGLQVLHDRLQPGNARFERADILLGLDRRMLPDLLGQRGHGLHGHRMV
jgi:hypothetical protein